MASYDPVPGDSFAWTEVLVRALTQRLAPVGFERQTPPAFLSPIEVPARMETWFAPYGFLLLHYAERETAAASLGENAAVAVARTIAGRARERGRVWDAYVIVALESAPDSDLCRPVRAFELGRATARRHVVWPEGDPRHENSWAARLDRITCAALPTGKTAPAGRHDEIGAVPAWLAKIERDLVDGVTYESVLESLEDLAAGPCREKEEPSA